MLALALVAACGPSDRANGGQADAAAGADSQVTSGDGNNDAYIVYAHSDTVLYTIDFATKKLVEIGGFNAPNITVGSQTKPDPLTDLAVSPTGTIYVISETSLYTASASDGHVTRVGSLSTCGQRGVALTTTDDGRVWIGDYLGAICELDVTQNPPVVKAPVTMQGGYALSGDMVGIGNGTVFGTAYKTADQPGQGTQMNNVLVTVDLATGAVTRIGSSGYPKLFGTAFHDGKVYGFTHDQTGRVVEIDTASGQGTVFNTFLDSATSMGISFSGAGVSSLVVQ